MSTSRAEVLCVDSGKQCALDRPSFVLHMPYLLNKFREASTLIFKIRSCTVRSDLINKHEISRKCLIFKIRSYSARSDLKNKSVRFSGNFDGGEDWGHTPNGSYSPTKRSKHLLQNPLLRTPSENPTPSKNPSENLLQSPLQNLKTPFSEPFLEACAIG